MLDGRLKTYDKRGQGKRSREEGERADAPEEPIQTTLLLRLVITLLCGVGLYTSLFMLAKTRRAERGELTEPSVVQTARARLFGNVPNAALGSLYYPALAIGIWVAPLAFMPVLLAASLFAAGTSIVLAYSLLFVTRMPCPFCWTSHAINWILAVCNALLLFKISYWR